MSDEEINAAVAEKVAGFTDLIALGGDPRRLAGAMPDGCRSWVPYYLHDANATIALLDKEPFWDANTLGNGHAVNISKEGESIGFGAGNTFCRAACLALLSAHRK